ncbi:MAG: flagella synthesis protein FlgN [Cellvibrionaceae bacterium]
MNAKNFTEIHNMIKQDLASSRQLLALLEEETESTKSRDYMSLSRLLEEKTPLLEQLKKNAQTRSEWLTSIGKQADEKNWALLLNALNNQNLSQQWQEVKTTVEHCQKINTINGKLINRGVTSHTRLLQIMRGNTHQADLYDAKGTKHSTALSGRVTQA